MSHSTIMDIEHANLEAMSVEDLERLLSTMNIELLRLRARHEDIKQQIAASNKEYEEIRNSTKFPRWTVEYILEHLHSPPSDDPGEEALMKQDIQPRIAAASHHQPPMPGS